MQDPALFNFSATANIPGALVLTLDPPPEVDLAGCTVRAAVAVSGTCGRLLDCGAINPEKHRYHQFSRTSRRMGFL